MPDPGGSLCALTRLGNSRCTGIRVLLAPMLEVAVALMRKRDQHLMREVRLRAACMLAGVHMEAGSMARAAVEALRMAEHTQEPRQQRALCERTIALAGCAPAFFWGEKALLKPAAGVQLADCARSRGALAEACVMAKLALEGCLLTDDNLVEPATYSNTVVLALRAMGMDIVGALIREMQHEGSMKTFGILHDLVRWCSSITIGIITHQATSLSPGAADFMRETINAQAVVANLLLDEREEAHAVAKLLAPRPATAWGGRLTGRAWLAACIAREATIEKLAVEVAGDVDKEYVILLAEVAGGRLEYKLAVWPQRLG
ncbi:hypothetical protein WJX72_000917 [[Myrmecia] bisecta]|uniref:Uncharacterized protein n=1 Tax=[Myrmecia] bisecta TaxID=41462 RepID=A0AAW1R4W7_9CHLO